MADQFDLDEKAAVAVERLYSFADVVRRRMLVSQALAAAPGEHLLDVGCGPGFYVAELAETVGESGRVTGVDSSKVMLAAAARRAEGLANAELLVGDATHLPVPDGSFDAAFSVQVFEYIDDTNAALSEMYRVLRPGGRIVVWDIDWSTVSWYSADVVRMANVLKAWESHFAHPRLPQRLGAEMSHAGFVNVQVEGHAFVHTEAGTDTYGEAILAMVGDFVAGRGVSVEEEASWRAELKALSDANEYLFSLTHLCFSASRPCHDGGGRLP